MQRGKLKAQDNETQRSDNADARLYQPSCQSVYDLLVGMSSYIAMNQLSSLPQTQRTRSGG